MDRRGFLSAILASACAPAIVRVGSLMRVPGIMIPTTAQVLAVSYGNKLLTASVISSEALLILQDCLRFTEVVNQEWMRA